MAFKPMGDRATLESRMAAALERNTDRTVTFQTQRGTFSIPADLLEDGREADLARHYAQRMPEGALPAGRIREKDGSVTVRWRKTRVIEV